MFRVGEIVRETECRATGDEYWRDVNEFFPLLKYPRAETPVTGDRVLPRQVLAPTVKQRTSMLWLLIPLTAVFSAAMALFINARIFPRPIAAVLPMVRIPETKIHASSARFSTPAARRSSSAHSAPETRRVVTSAPPQRTIPRATPKPVQPAREYTIPLNQHATIHTDFGPLSVRIVDHGLVTFSVSVNHSRMRRLEKEKGFETNGTNITEIYSFGRARVYYVDRISVSSGKCVLKVIPL